MGLVPLDAHQLRTRKSLKWSRTRSGLVPLDIAEADFAVAEPIREALANAVAASDLGYPDFDSPRGGPHLLAETFADRMDVKFGVPIDPGRVEICAQVMQALCCVILEFSKPGERILTHTPSYPPIVAAIERLGRKPVLVPVEPAPASPPLSSERVAVIILCQPHNPTGRIFTTGQLEAIAERAAVDDAVIFADEIHHDLTYEMPHRSIATVGNSAGRTIVFTSAAKSFNIPGLRCAVGHFGSSTLHRRYLQIPWHLRSGAGILGIEATVAAWTECEPWLTGFRRQLRQNRALVTSAFRPTTVGHVPPDATYFAWLDLNEIADVAVDPLATFEAEAKVILQRGTLFGEGHSRFARLNFALPTTRLSDVLSTLSRCFFDDLQQTTTIQLK